MLTRKDLSTTEADLNVMLEEVRLAQPRVEWTKAVVGKESSGVLSLPFGNFISGKIFDGADNIRGASIDLINVDEKLQRNGIGFRLLKSFVAEVKRYGATYLKGDVADPVALKMRVKLFGFENLRFYESFSGREIKMSLEEALSQKPHWNVVANLENVDTADWELPIEK